MQKKKKKKANVEKDCSHDYYYSMKNGITCHLEKKTAPIEGAGLSGKVFWKHLSFVRVKHCQGDNVKTKDKQSIYLCCINQSKKSTLCCHCLGAPGFAVCRVAVKIFIRVDDPPERKLLRSKGQRQAYLTWCIRVYKLFCCTAATCICENLH